MEDQLLNEKEELKDEKPSNNKKTISLICSALLFGTVSGAAFVGVGYMGNEYIKNNRSVETINSTVVVNTDSPLIQSDVVSLVENAMPSIVSITNMSVSQVQSYFGGMQTMETQSAGSGIIINQTEDELFILTNYHVIEDATTLTITFSNQTSVEAVVKGGMESKDMAVVAVNMDQLDDETLDHIKVAVMGDSSKLQPGEQVIAIGNALGYGQSVTTGVISATDRTVEGIDAVLLQTDAAINPGNSGGALLNMNGEVIGMNTVKISSSASNTNVEGMGYAISITDAVDSINTMMTYATKEKVAVEDQGALGISGSTVTEEIHMLYQIPQGVYINEIVEGSAAQKAGLEKGTVIVAIEGVSVSSIEELIEILGYYEAGTKVDLSVKVLVEGEYIDEEITLTLQSK